jgi:hypothetical protein
VATSSAVTVTASAGGASLKANVKVTAPVILAGALSPLTVKGGTSSTLTVTLNGVAPTGGTVVALTSSSTTAVVPVRITVPAGQVSVTQVIRTLATTRSRTARITATTGATAMTATLSITP